MTVVMRLVSLVLIVAALMLLGADAVTSLEKGGEVTVRSVGLVWSLFDAGSLNAAKAWMQNRAPQFLTQFFFSILAMPGWSITGVVGVIIAFIFGRKLAPA